MRPTAPSAPRRPRALALACALTAASGLAAASAMAAAPPRVPPPPAAPRAAPVWTPDKAASRLSFRGQIAGQPFDGVFKRWDAQVAFDPANLPASRLVIVVQADSAVTGQPARDAQLPGPDWLAAARFPRATFISRSVTAAGPGRYLIAGALELRGATRPVSLPVTVEVARDKLLLTSELTLDRSAFGVGMRRFGAGSALALPVSVSLRLTARRAR